MTLPDESWERLPRTPGTLSAGVKWSWMDEKFELQPWDIYTKICVFNDCSFGCGLICLQVNNNDFITKCSSTTSLKGPTGRNNRQNSIKKKQKKTKAKAKNLDFTTFSERVVYFFSLCWNQTLCDVHSRPALPRHPIPLGPLWTFWPSFPQPAAVPPRRLGLAAVPQHEALALLNGGQRPEGREGGKDGEGR